MKGVQQCTLYYGMYHTRTQWQYVQLNLGYCSLGYCRTSVIAGFLGFQISSLVLKAKAILLKMRVIIEVLNTNSYLNNVNCCTEALQACIGTSRCTYHASVGAIARCTCQIQVSCQNFAPKIGPRLLQDLAYCRICPIFIFLPRPCNNRGLTVLPLDPCMIHSII